MKLKEKVKRKFLLFRYDVRSGRHGKYAWQLWLSPVCFIVGFFVPRILGWW
jgi:hypothetical protein